jgi:hypothetical protein
MGGAKILLLRRMLVSGRLFRRWGFTDAMGQIADGVDLSRDLLASVHFPEIRMDYLAALYFPPFAVIGGALRVEVRACKPNAWRQSAYIPVVSCIAYSKGNMFTAQSSFIIPYE